ncbi:MAG: hypothetical protein KAR38_16820 [Calditrichia bacterium]|nr:hypothetical protein [Calditrichia bacterium]
MEIRYIEPLSESWEKMKKALFNPFDLGKWFVVGFTAFLAGLIDSFPHGGGSFNNDIGDSDFCPADASEIPHIVSQWFVDNPGWTIFIAIIILIIIIVVLLFTWLSSRGKFMFLDNVVHNKSEVVKPWHKFKNHGNSLFLWRIAFGLACFFTVLLFIFIGVYLAIGISNGNYIMPITSLIGLFLLFFLSIIIMTYIALFLTDFVVPIMYKHNLTATKAWAKFIPLFKQHFWHFILYGLFLLVLFIGIFIAVAMAGFLTCCLGFLLLIIPYIGSVLLLPITYTYRAFSVAFLEQFGDEYKIYPEVENKVE